MSTTEQQTEKMKITDFSLAEDLQTFITLSSDVTFADDSLIDSIYKLDPFDLIKIEKEIASPIKILSVEKVTEKSISADLSMAVPT